MLHASRCSVYDPCTLCIVQQDAYGPVFLSNMIVATTPVLLLLLFLDLEMPFPFWTFARGFLALFCLPLLEEFTDCVFLLEPFFFAFACTLGVVQCPMGADLSSTQ